MSIKKPTLFILFIAFILQNHLLSQDVTTLKKLKPFIWTAGISSSVSSITSNAPTNNYSKLAYSIGLNGSASIYGIQIPFNFIYRDRQASYSTSFSRFSISPSYKWAKLYLGHNQVEYNRYLLSGMQIYGAGLDINPGILRLGVLTGVVKNTKIIIDSLNGESGVVNPFRRKLTAFKLGIGKKRNYFDLLLLNGKDTEVKEIMTDSLFIPKQANTNLGFSSAFDVIKNSLSFSVNACLSGFTDNVNGRPIDQKDLDNNKYLAFANNNFTINNTTSTRFAGDALLTFQFSNFSISSKYQRIDPFYKSFGVNYIRGDHENISLQSSFSLFNGIVALFGSYGVDRNNLSALRQSTARQKIYDVGLNLIPNKWFGIELQLSNFNFNQQAATFAILDSVRLVQINATNSISPYLRFSNKKNSHGINLNYTSQKLDDITNEENLILNSSNTSMSIGYQYKDKIKKWGTSLNVYNFTYTTITNNSNRTGLTLLIGKSFLNDNLNVRLRSSLSRNSENAIVNGWQYNISPNINYKIGKGIIQLQMNFNSKPPTISKNRYNESRIYTNFSIPIK